MEGKRGPISNRVWIDALEMSSERTKRDVEKITTTLASMRRESLLAL